MYYGYYVVGRGLRGAEVDVFAYRYWNGECFIDLLLDISEEVREVTGGFRNIENVFDGFVIDESGEVLYRDQIRWDTFGDRDETTSEWYELGDGADRVELLLFSDVMKFERYLEKRGYYDDSDGSVSDHHADLMAERFRELGGFDN